MKNKRVKQKKKKNILVIFIRNLCKLIDKSIVVPVTKFFVMISEKFNKRTGGLERWLVRKNTLVFISLLIAIAFFFYVDSRSSILVDSSAEVLREQKVIATYNKEAYVVEGLPEVADVTLIGRRVDLYLAKQLSTGNVTVDISNLKPGTHKVNLNYETSINTVDYSLNPSTVTVIIYPKVSATRTANIDVINQDKLDYKLSIQDVTIDQNEIIIKGAEHTLNKVATVKALVDINNIVEENNIFGRVKPEEKRLLIRALKNNGHVVAMTGDGVNDVLALKESDCGIAMNSLSDAARNVSELVLLDSNFEAMPKIVKEGRQSINNIERSATLFLSKTIYASLLAILFLFINYSYPFWPIQMTLINSLTIGIPAFILALEKNNERVKGKFLINVISKSIPSGITTVINILLLVFLSNIFNISEGQISTCAVIITGYTAILLIYRISKPLNLLRKALLFSLIFIFSLALITPIGREVFYLEFLSPNSLLILLPLMYLSTRLFVFLSRILNVIIKRKGNWFI